MREEIVISDSEEEEPVKDDDAITIEPIDPAPGQGGQGNREGVKGDVLVCSLPVGRKPQKHDLSISSRSKVGEEEGIQVKPNNDVEASLSNQPSTSAEVAKVQNYTKGDQKKEEEVVEVGRSDSRKRKLDVEPLLMSPRLKHHYYYFCLNCEEEKPGSKFPITLDIASHIMEKGHTDFRPIIPDRGHISFENIPFSPNLNKKVSKEWQRLVFNADSEELKTFKYSSARSCLKCDQKFRDSADMFIHIRNAHVRKSVNK